MKKSRALDRGRQTRQHRAGNAQPRPSARRSARSRRPPDGDILSQPGGRRWSAGSGCRRPSCGRRRRTCRGCRTAASRASRRRSATGSSGIAPIPPARALMPDGSPRPRPRELRCHRHLARRQRSRSPIDSSATIPSGVAFEGPAGLRQVLLSRGEEFANAVTEKLLASALGRGLEYHDCPAVAGLAARGLPARAPGRTPSPLPRRSVDAEPPGEPDGQAGRPRRAAGEERGQAPACSV